MANPVVSGYIQLAEPLEATATWPEIEYFFSFFFFFLIKRPTSRRTSLEHGQLFALLHIQLNLSEEKTMLV